MIKTSVFDVTPQDIFAVVVDKNIVGYTDNQCVFLSKTNAEKICSEEELNKCPKIALAEYNERKLAQLISGNPFERDISKRLQHWKDFSIPNKKHSVLMLEGARQVGKTAELLKFGYSGYDSVAYINVVELSQKALLVLDEFLDALSSGWLVAQVTYRKLCEECNLPLYLTANSILIFDEVQAHLSIYNRVRLLQQHVPCQVAMTGSYLGFIGLTKEQVFVPMGNLQTEYMYPLSFAEYCGVYHLRESLESLSLVGESKPEQYDRLYALYQQYLQTGGYPEAVRVFNSKGILECKQVHQKLLQAFLSESRIYIDKQVYDILPICLELASMAAFRRKTFNTSSLIKSLEILKSSAEDYTITNKTVTAALYWLTASCVFYRGVRYDANGFVPNAQLYFSDVGIASTLAGNYRLTDNTVKGFISEVFAFDELYRFTRSAGDTNLGFAKIDNYELDLMFVHNGKRYGFEIKSGNTATKSLRYFIDHDLVDVPVKAANTRGGNTSKFITIPIYAIGARFPYNGEV